MLGRRFLALVCLGLASLAAPPARAQNAGSVTGTIVDNSGQVVPGATITLIDERTNSARTLSSDGKGDFLFLAVPPGTYLLKVELAGFRTVERRGNVLNASANLALGRLQLEVGAVAEVLTVEVQGAKVETTNSDHSGLLTSTQIQQIQTKGRDVMNLLRLIPGVRYGDDVDALGESFGTLVPHIGGQRQHWNAVMVDGVLGNEVSGSNRFSSALNLDAIGEVKVLLNTYKAEFGRTGGANIQIVSKGGGTDYAGSAYYFGRRDSWNANTWQNNKSGIERGKYVYDTYGFNFGGPVRIPGLIDQKGEKKLFFFYSLENPRVNTPAQLRQYRMPTALERNGDFSQTFDTTGRLMFIKDPLSSGACSVTAGGPGCFPGNIIPANRFDANARALINMLPLPNKLDSPTPSIYNFVRQETPEKPRLNNLLRLDWKPSASNSWFLTLRTFNSTQTGSEITAGPAKWGYFDAQYIFSDSGITVGHTHIFRSNLINEASFGFKRATEGFPAATDADYNKIKKSNIGYNLGQFNPGLNPDGIMPNATFGLANAGAGVDSPDFTFDNRLGQTAWDWVYSLRENLTWLKGSHTFKAGLYGEFMKNHEARGGQWNGQFQYQNNTANPLNTNFAFSNALLVFSQYTETDRYRETLNKGWLTEWYIQDTWRTSRRLTVDYGVRLLWYTPFYRADDNVANFDPSRYDRAKAPRLYMPALINGQRMAFDSITGQTLNPIFIGAYVPGTGDPNNGMVKAGDPGVPLGFRDNQGVEPEPRAGFAWDVFGTGKTALRASAGVFHNARLGGGSQGNLAGNPPFIHNPIVYYGTMSTLLQPGVTLANRPSTVEALEQNAKTPSAYNWSVGVQQDIGWGTVVDVSYVGSVTRHMEMYTNINPVPDGARFLDQNPQNRDPAAPTSPLSDDFLRPYYGLGAIRRRDDWATSNYNALQFQANRRYTRGLQIGLSYTYSRSLGLADEDPGNLSAAINRDPQQWLYAPLASSQQHNLVINYTWDVPKLSSVWNKGLVRAVFDGWQISGENAFVSGDWAPIFLTTVDNFDFTGGDNGTGSDAGGGFRLVRPRMVGNPQISGADPLSGWFNVSAFARPTGRGDYGNTPRNVIRRPGINNWNLSAFKNFGLGANGKRRLQFRLEAYNVLNHTQFSDINRTARFDAQGNQTDATFGLANTARLPRVMQASIRLNF